MEQNKIKFSIIIPVYNAAKYVERCVNSVLKQTESNWELILINDGSIDNSDEICRRLTSRDKRIKYISQENSGVSAARNRGLDLSLGEWITFIDSDDWIEPFHLDTFNQQIERGVDLCINSFVADLYYGHRKFLYPKLCTLDINDSLDKFFGPLKQHSQFLWIKAFRANIIEREKLRFDENVNLGEDNIFILSYLPFIQRISSIPVASYHYDQKDVNPNSLGRRKRNPKDALFQIQQNTNAILNLFDKTSKKFLLIYSSDYYYTRVFERILVVNSQSILLGLMKKPLFVDDFTSINNRLDIKYIHNYFVRMYWQANRPGLKSLLIFNLYLFKKCSKLKIIRLVAAVKHVVKFVLRIALR